MCQKRYTFLFPFIVFFLGCQDPSNVKLQTGDLLFRGSSETGLSGAIDEVTNAREGNHFSHVGIVEKKDDGLYVIHAHYERGVCKQPLDSFLMDEGGNQRHTVAYRLKEGIRCSIDDAMKRVNSVIGQPYNYSYLIEDSGFYCSELVWWAFSPDSVFSLSPMTFRNPVTGRFPEVWVDHYARLGVEIPEGKPGCNPNGLAESDAIFRMGIISDESSFKGEKADKD